MNAQNETDPIVKVYRRDTDAPAKETGSSGTGTSGPVKMPGMVGEHSPFPEQIDDSALVQDARVSTGTKRKMPDLILEKIDQTRGVISWGDREYDIEEFRALLMKKPGSLMEEDRNETG